jgi:hypothetical protein
MGIRPTFSRTCLTSLRLFGFQGEHATEQSRRGGVGTVERVPWVYALF